MSLSHTLKTVDTEFFTSTTLHPRASKRISCDADTLFRILADVSTWPRWTRITEAEYTTPPPYGIATQRQVKIGHQVLHEEFLVWEPGERMAFYVDSSTLPMKALAEDLTITPEDKNHCTLTWTTALEGRPRALGRSLAKIAYMEETRALDHLETFVGRHKHEYANPQ